MGISKFLFHRGISGGVVLAVWLVHAAALADAPSFRWAQRAGGNTNDYAVDIAVDTAGNSYALGKFTSANADFGTFALTNGGLFVVKYDTNGNTLWAKRIGPSSLGAPDIVQYVPFIAADEHGNGYVAGKISSGAQMDFDGTQLTNSGSGRDFFLAKFDSTGAVAWARMSAGSGATNKLLTSALSVDEEGNCYVAGNYFGAANFGNTSLAPDTNGGGIFVANYDAQGNFVRAFGPLSESVGSGSGAFPARIALGHSGDFFIVGRFVGTMVFGSTAFTNSNGIKSDVFATRYDSTGSLIWANTAGSTGSDAASGLTVDATGASYFLGRAGQNGVDPPGFTIAFDGYVLTNYSAFSFLVKYDAYGNVVWRRMAGEFAADTVYAQGFPLRLSGDAVGNSFVIGQFFGTAKFDNFFIQNPGGGGLGLYDYPSYFVSKLDSTGQALWTKQFGALDVYEYESAAIATDPAGNCSVAGFIYGTNAPFDSFMLSSIGGGDAFVARLDADPPRLDIARVGNSVVISWPTNQPSFVLESVSFLPATNSWAVVTNGITFLDAQNFITNPITTGSQFYRLRKQ